ncbi:MAG TPA: hypothetical protein VMH81_29460 [Bryobacteraceae bacterium]|nr:hypothetical protein [Bryobacteraceae bacterium]
MKSAATEVALGRLHGNVPKKKLHLLQFAARRHGRGEHNFF